MSPQSYKCSTLNRRSIIAIAHLQTIIFLLAYRCRVPASRLSSIAISLRNNEITNREPDCYPTRSMARSITGGGAWPTKCDLLATRLRRLSACEGGWTRYQEEGTPGRLSRATAAAAASKLPASGPHYITLLLC